MCTRVHVCVLLLLVPRCDTVDSDSSRAVVPEMFHVASLGFVIHFLAPYAVGCALLYVPIHGRTQTVIVGEQWGVRVDFFPSITLLSFFLSPMSYLHTHECGARHCGAV